MRGGGGAGGDGRHGTGRRGPPFPTKTVWHQAVDLGGFFFSFAPSLLFLLFLLPPALFVEPNQKCQSVRVSQKGSDYKITETDVGPAHTHPHTEAEARAAPRGRRAGIKQPPTTPAGPPLSPPSRLCPVPSPCPAGCPPAAAGAGPARPGDERRPRPSPMGSAGARRQRRQVRTHLGEKFFVPPALLRATFLSSASAPAPLPAPFPLP